MKQLACSNTVPRKFSLEVYFPPGCDRLPLSGNIVQNR